MANSKEGDRSDGGAMFLGLWSSVITLYNSTFSNNSASGHGGAISGWANSGTIRIDNSTASNNTAVERFEQSLDLTGLGRRRSMQSEGGALRVQGSGASLMVVGTRVANNQAGRVSLPNQGMCCRHEECHAVLTIATWTRDSRSWSCRG